MYSVGQILYVIVLQKQKIIPVQVVEHVVRRSLGGESVQYLVRLPSQKNLVDLSTFGDEIYSTIDLVKEKLKERLYTVIEDLATSASELATQHFPPNNQNDDNLPDDKPVQVMLDDGTLANIKVHDIHTPPPRARGRKSKKGKK